MVKVLSHGVRSRAHFFQTEIRYLMHQFRWVEVPIVYRNPSNRLGASSLKDALGCLWELRRRARRGDAACASAPSDDGGMKP